MVTWVSLLLCCSQAAADLLVRTVTVNNVNYDDFSLLCAEGIPLLMEDHKPRPCQPRPWKAEQRCPVGFWCHEGDDESSYYCCPRSRKVSNHCHLPPATGFGKQLMRRFYYDWKTDGCHELHYTGIGGNENSYMTYESCEGACRGTGEPTPKVFGGLSSGSSNKEDKKNPEKDKNSKIKNKGPTISFTISSTEIPQVIPSSESVEIPSYSALTSTMKKVTEPATTYIQSTFSSSPPTTYTNEASTLTEIVANPCILPPERGSSGGIARKMWYFDMSTLSCVQFTYQGSGGNSNKFERSPTCMAVCGIGKPTRKSCDLPASVGEGPFKIPRFFFDSKTQRCELFYYSGENGNDNRFFKKHKCERLCLGKASKKKEQTRIPEQVTYAPTRKNVNFVPNETQPPTESFERGRTATTPKTKQIEIERPNHITRKPAQPQTEHTHYERFETKRPPLVVEMLPETTGTKTTSTTPLFYTAPPTTPSYPSNFFIQTETVRPFEPQTFPTLVYVPKEEDSDSTTAPFAPYPQATVRTEKPMDELFNHLMTVKLPTFTQAPPKQINQPDLVGSIVPPQPQHTYQPQSPQPQLSTQPQPQNVVQPYRPLPPPPLLPTTGQPRPVELLQKTIPPHTQTNGVLVSPDMQPVAVQENQPPSYPTGLPMLPNVQTYLGNQLQQPTPHPSGLPMQPHIQPQSALHPVQLPSAAHQPQPPMSQQTTFPIFPNAGAQPHPQQPNQPMPSVVQYPQPGIHQPPPAQLYPQYPEIFQPQQPMIQGQRTGDRGYSTGAPTIVEKSQIGPAPDTHVPLGNFPWATTPPGYTMPTGINPPVYVGTNEQLEAMVMAMGVHPPPSHQVHVGPPQQQVIPPPPEMNVQPPNYPTYQGIKSAVPPPGSLLSMPALQRQWGTSSPHNPAVQVPSQHIDSQPSFQLGLASLPNVAVPVSSSGNQVASEDRRGNFQPSQSPAAPFVPTPQQLPGTLPPAFIPQSPVGSFQPHPGAVIGQQGVRAYVNHIATQTFGVNLIHEPIGSFQPNPNNSSKVEVVTHHPDYNLPNINVSIVNDLNSPCQLPVTNPDVIIMCEQEDVYCLVGSFCQVGLGQSICCPSLGISPCLQPLQRGVGVAQIPRWFFNPHTKRCEVFSFGGFQGNENNFLTYSDCQNTCDAMNPCERGQPVPATNPDQQCSVNNRCPAESMCHAVGLTSYCCNVRKPVTSPQKPKLDNDPCRQQILEGTGTASDHRWAFDQNLGRCVSFIYQGENGNLNNFLTKSDCQAICGAPPTVPSRCLQPGMSGDGDDYLARYFYSPEYRQCLHFIYSGKGGTENNFESQQDCIETCIANGVKFSSLASTVPQPTFSFSFMPSPICPQGAALLDSNNEPMSCNVSECPNGYVCTTLGPQQFCCPAPESFCLEPRPAVSVCEKGGTPAVQIRFTYDPLSDKCVRFSYENCNPNVASLNSFATQPQCSRLCCNQGFNLLYRRKVRMLLNDDPMIKRSRRI